MPTLTVLLAGFASKLTDLENYETVDCKTNTTYPRI